MGYLKGRIAGFLDGLFTKSKPATPLAIKQRSLESSKEMIDSVSYPPKADGIELFPCEIITAAHNDILKTTMFELGLVDPCQIGFNPDVLTSRTRIYNYQTLVESVVNKFISYAHLLPASENHHHSAVGGLVRHSLEVALYSLRHITKLELPPVRFPDELISKKVRWEYAAWITGLAHDLGKPLFDMKVVDESGLVWNPNTYDIFTWQSMNQVKKYQVQWRHTARHGKHTGLATIILERILSHEAKQFLFDGSDDLQIMMQEALSGIGSGKNPIMQALKKGEARSVHNDMKWQWDRLTGGRKLTVEAAFVKKLTMIRREWKINTLNEGKVWVIGQDAFVTYPGAIQIIMDDLRKDGWSVPLQATIMTEMLLDRSLVEPILEGYNTGYFKPDGLTGRPDRVIKLKWAGMLFEDEIIPRGASGIIEVTKDGEKGVIYHENSTVETFNNEVSGSNKGDNDSPVDSSNAPSQSATEPKTEEPKQASKPKQKKTSKAAKKNPVDSKVKTDEIEVAAPEKTNSFKGIVFANASSIDEQLTEADPNKNTEPAVNSPAPVIEEIKTEPTKSTPQAIEQTEKQPTKKNAQPKRNELLVEKNSFTKAKLVNDFIKASLAGELIEGTSFTLEDNVLNLPTLVAKSLVDDIGDEINDLKNSGRLVLNPKTPRKTTEKIKVGPEVLWCYRIKLTTEQVSMMKPHITNHVDIPHKVDPVSTSVSSSNNLFDKEKATSLPPQTIDESLEGVDEVTRFINWLKVQQEPLAQENDENERIYNLKECLSVYVKTSREGAPVLELKKALGKITKSIVRIKGKPWILLNIDGEK